MEGPGEALNPPIGHGEKVAYNRDVAAYGIKLQKELEP